MTRTSRIFARIAIALVIGLALLPSRLQGAGFDDGAASATQKGAKPELVQQAVRLEEALAPHSLQGSLRSTGWRSSSPRTGGRPSPGWYGRSEADDPTDPFQGLDGFAPGPWLDVRASLDALEREFAVLDGAEILHGIHWSALPPIGALAPPLA